MRAVDYLQSAPQYTYPQHFVSRLMLRATRIRCRAIKNTQIRWFVRHYGVDMSEAEEPDPRAYPDFNSFFTRSLRPAVRPVASAGDAIVSPADGEVSHLGRIDDTRLLQAKGQSYDLDRLLAGGRARCAPFRDGHYITIYLSPRDYHRVHMPFGGRLREMVYVPGRLFSVNQATTRTVPQLFARNERVITVFDTEGGPMALILVGAIFVGCMETVWAGTVTPARDRRLQVWRFDGEDRSAPYLQKGQEMGRFNMGSTVIVLFPQACAAWAAELHPGTPIRMGAQIGTLRARTERGAVR